MTMNEASVPQDMTERASPEEGAGPDVSFVVAALQRSPLHRGRHRLGPGADRRPPVEVIVVDDASSDDTPAIVAAVAASRPARGADPAHRASGGPSVSPNEAMRKARGVWIAVLDADDLIAPSAAAA